MYKDSLIQLNLSLATLHKYLDVVFFFRVVTRRIEINPTVIPQIRGRIRTTSYSRNPDITLFSIRPCTSATVQWSFLNRNCTIWNTLAADLGLSISCYLKLPFMVATHKPVSLSTSLMTLALLNLHACPVTLPANQDETLPVSFDSTVNFTYFSHLCLRLATIGSCC